MRAAQTANKQSLGYDRRCRELSTEERTRLEAAGAPSVVRFKTPLDGRTVFHDMLRGEVVFENSTIDDFVLLKIGWLSRPITWPM